MSITIADPDLLAKLAGRRGLIELQDPTGETVGRVQTTWPAPLDGCDCFLESVVDPTLLAAFTRVRQPVLLFDSCGELVGRFERDWYGMLLTPGRLRAIEEERIAARKRKGHTLAEVWKIIYEKYVGDEVEPFIVDGRETVG